MRHDSGVGCVLARTRLAENRFAYDDYAFMVQDESTDESPSDLPGPVVTETQLWI